MDEPAPLHPGVKMLWWTVALGITVPATAVLLIAGRMFRWPLLSWVGPSVVSLALAAVLPPFIYRRWR